MTGPFCACGALGRPVYCYACDPAIQALPDKKRPPAGRYRRRSRDYYERHKEACKARVNARRKADGGRSEKARQAVHKAIKAGQLTIPETCSRCGTRPPPRINSTRATGLEAHHHQGYDEAHQLDVEWLCKPCHAIADKERKS